LWTTGAAVQLTQLDDYVFIALVLMPYWLLFKYSIIRSKIQH